MTFKPIGCLSTYIAKVHYGTSFGHETIFDYGLAHISPYLKRDQINRILVYPGSFNPPHVGHQASLSYAFNNSGCGLNLIAAIILPLDDNSLIMKVGTRKGAVVLTKEQRVGLWRGQSGLEPGPSFWIFDRSTDKWNSLQKRLAEAVSADGFKIDFGSRTREHLIQLKTCGPWELVQPDMDHLQRRAKEGAYWIYSGLIMLDTTSARGILKSGNLALTAFGLRANSCIGRSRMYRADNEGATGRLCR